MRLLLLAFPLLAVAACGDDVPVARQPQATTPTTVTYVGGDVSGHDLVTGTTIRLTLGGGSVAADAGCNHLSGTAAEDDGVLVVGPLAGTEMGCDPERMAQDEWLAEFLTSRPDIRRTAERLVLTAGSVTVTLTDEKHVQAQHPVPLEGTTWVLDSIAEGQGGDAPVSSTVARATVELDGNRLSVDTGCNSGSTTVTQVAGDRWSLGPLALTKMACDKARLHQERIIAQVLDGEVSVVHNHDGLTLTSADGALALGFFALSHM